MTAARLVLAPDVDYDRVADALAGWDGPLDVVVGLDGEPILARWTHDDAEVRFSAIPDIGLRVLQASDDLRLPSLPTTALGAAALQARAADMATALRGVTTLGLLEDLAALPLLAAIEADPATPAPVRGAAELATRRLGTLAAVVGAEHIARRRDRHPDRDPVLGLLRPPAVRRQAVRAFRAQPTGGPRRCRDVVLAGLADEDWEVRWSAVLAAHDLGVVDALIPVRRCPLGRGPDADQRRVLDAVRDVVGHRLAGSTSRHAAAPFVAALLDSPEDGPPPGDDGAFLLVHALRTPLPEPPTSPEPPPPQRGYAEVAAVCHWLGGRGAAARALTPGDPFAVAVEPIDAVPITQVDARLAEAALETGRPLRLPTAAELEMSIRGPDGRRYPWGNGREQGWRRARSPWDLARPCHGPEWVTHDGQLLAAPPARLGLGAPPTPVTVAALRPVLVDPPPAL